ncbi:MAG TPA: SusC/RagA family TonB-linked outer membrane protein, partial [Flavobacteriaceae bacterium]|nr:SusC/RagA family TonB-linked outer membrane protein [Flavobacteriaceae bacterium]
MKHFKFILIALLFSQMLLAQTTVTGTVTDATGFPLPGASILVKGTTKGEITNIDGNYTINLDQTPSTLVFSYLGFISKEIEVTNQTTLNVILEENQELLDEIVVIGYGQVDKDDLTGSVATVKPKKALVNQSQGVESLLQGQAAGVYVQQNAGAVSAASIKIRGLNSLTGNTEPLYVIDGIIVDSAVEDTLDPLSGGNSYLAPQGGITGINPRDIESIEVLKDASATAIYGSRGANGVIIITTKSGSDGNTQFNYSTTTRIGSVANDIEVLGFRDYVGYQNDVRANQGFDPRFYTYPDGSIADFAQSEQFMIDNSSTIARLEGIDWSDDIYKTSILTNHRITASGGSDKMKYYFAAGYLDNQDVLPNAFARAVDFNANLTNNLTDRLKLSTKVAVSHTKNSQSKGTENLGGTSNSIIRQIVSAAPILGFDDNFEGGEYDLSLDGPRAWVSDYDDQSKDIRFLGSLKLNYEISKIFDYQVTVGTDYRIKKRQIWFGTALRRGRQANGEAGLSTLDRFRYNIDNTLMFNHKFNKNHRINGTVGFVVDARKTEFTTAAASDFPLQDLGADGI